LNKEREARLYNDDSYNLSKNKLNNDDSLEFVISYFIVDDAFINSCIVSEKDIEDIYIEHKDWIPRYFPEILKTKDLTLYSKFLIAIYLYKIDKREYLNVLWDEYKRFAGNGNDIQPIEEFIPILELLKIHNIKLM
jgi:hypothetical protein